MKEFRIHSSTHLFRSLRFHLNSFAVVTRAFCDLLAQLTQEEADKVAHPFGAHPGHAAHVTCLCTECGCCNRKSFEVISRGHRVSLPVEP